VIFIALVVIAIYIIPRGLQVGLQVGDIDLLLRTQLAWNSLRFSFLTMSILWPIIVSVLCIVFEMLALRHQKILKRILSKHSKLSVNELMLADPHYLFSNTNNIKWQKGFRNIIKYLPTIALAIHALMSLLNLYLSILQYVEFWFYITSSLQLVLSIIAIPISLKFSRTIEYLSKVEFIN